MTSKAEGSDYEHDKDAWQFAGGELLSVTAAMADVAD